jgi:O-antigen ligase
MSQSASIRHSIEPADAFGPGDWIRALMAVAAVVLFYTNLDAYAFAAYSLPPPSKWVLAFTGAAALTLLVAPRRAGPVLPKPLVGWILFYFCLSTVWAVFMVGTPERVQALFDRYRSIALLLALAVVFNEPRARRLGALTLGAAVVLASILNVGELFGWVRFAEHAEFLRIDGRAAGLYVNPNTSGQAIALGLAVATAAFPRAFRMPLLLVGAAGVAATFSRGAGVCLVLVFGSLALRRALGTWTVVLGTLGVFLLLLYGAHYLETNDLLRPDTAARIRLTQDDSGRIDLARQAWEAFLGSPLVGIGLGTTAMWETAPHNIFVALAAEHGILGLLAYPALGVALYASNRSALLPALVLLTLGLFSHNQLTDRYSLLAIALVAVPASPVLAGSSEAPREGDALGST